MRLHALALLAALCTASCAGSASDAGTHNVPVVRRAVGPRVIVQDPSGKPLLGAWIVVEDLGTSARITDVVTGPDGEARLPALREGTEFRLRVSPPGDSPLLAKSVQWAPRPETTIRLERMATRFERMATVEGTIVDAEGKPVPRAKYWVLRGQRSWIEGEFADDLGRFKVDRISGDDVSIAAGDFPWHQWSLPGVPSLDEPDAVLELATRIQAGTRDARVPLAAERSLRVTLVGPDDAKPDDATTVLFGPIAKRWGDRAHHWPLVVDAGRALLFTGLTPDFEYSLLARSPSRGLVAWSEHLRPGRPAVATWCEGKSLVGKVVLPDRKELHDVEVRAEIGRLSIDTKAGCDGSFRLEDLPPTTVTIAVFASEADGGGYDRFDATPGGEPVTLSPKKRINSAEPR